MYGMENIRQVACFTCGAEMLRPAYRNPRKHFCSLKCMFNKPFDQEKFWSKFDKSGPIPDGRPELGRCWVWQGLISKSGYGVSCQKGAGSRQAHRRAYVLAKGDIPSGLDLDHLCRNRACGNPGHLEPVTRLVNSRRGIRSRTATCFDEDKCPHGHPWSENAYTHKGRRLCHSCRRQQAKENKAKRLMDPEYKAKFRASRAAQVRRKYATDPAFRERVKERTRLWELKERTQGR